MSEPPILDPHEAYALWAASYPPHAHNPLMKAEERAMLSLLPHDLRGLNVLDAACGSGRYLLHCLRRGASVVVGLDLSEAMLGRAGQEVREETGAHAELLQADLTALPMHDDWADITFCGLALGHLQDLAGPLAELRRVTRPGGLILCSDFHPTAALMNWPRDFKAGGRRYAVRHTIHTITAWREACHHAGLRIEDTLEPRLNPRDIPAGAQFDRTALEVPVALILALVRSDRRKTTHES